MICDYLTVTMAPESEHEIRSELDKILFAIGAVAVTDELFRVGQSGTFRRTARQGFVALGASGMALQSLRDKSLYGDYLSVLGSVPHRVSKMDIAHDVQKSAPRLLRAIYNRAKKTGVHLTRKKISPDNISRILKPCPWGDDTGTVYLGSRKSEVHCRVYDKRFQIFCSSAIDIGHELTRYEVSISFKAGATLHAAHSPDALFWHYMGDILPTPANAPVYSPGQDIGFVSPPKTELAPGEILKRKIADSPEIGLLLKLADDCGPNGLDFMLSQIKKRATHSPALLEVATGS